ncbi:flavin monoamine oxidase family protein [Chitinimonas sp. PSY-7]|uniref:FAD-dependent oxidoreductase n=1 Tax=Chitinimonas sp. PSY-7 TaxID=3459088 RepID=UPI00403FE4C7
MKPNEEVVVVIGAGLSGLHAAWRLQEQGIDVVVIEARTRAGGRILSPNVLHGTHKVDLGPSWYWPEFNPRLQAWINRLGLSTYPQHTRGASIYEMQTGEVRRTGGAWSQQSSSTRVTGGMSAISEGIRSKLGQVQWHFGTRLTALRFTPENEIELQLVDESRSWTLNASRVISTLAPRLLAGNIEANPPWPPIVHKSWLSTPTWMAGQAKFVAAYPEPFWRRKDLSGHAVSQRGPLVEVHDASDSKGEQAALFGFVGGSPSYRHALGADEVRRIALAQLVRLFGNEASQPIWTAWQDWSVEPLTSIELDLRTPTSHPLYSQYSLPEPWTGRVFLAGTEFAEQSGGFLEGALEAADEAVDALLNSLEPADNLTTQL